MNPVLPFDWQLHDTTYSVLNLVIPENQTNQKITKVKGCDLMLIKPECVWKVEVFYLKNSKQTAEKCYKVLKIEKIFHLSNTFWIYRHGVKSASFEHYCLLLL